MADSIKQKTKEVNSQLELFSEQVESTTDELKGLRDATEEENKSLDKKKKKELAAANRAAALGKATGKLTDKIKETAKASDTVTGTLDVFSDIIGNKAVQKLTLLAGATGIVAAQTVKYGKVLIDIQRTLPNFFNQGLGQALLDTGSLMSQTGLNIEQLGTVIKKNGLAFRKHGEQIGQVSDENEAFRIAMGLSRDTFVSLNARSILQEQTAAKGTLTTEQLTQRTRDYIIQLDELALQTGRSISEVEDARIANSRGSAGFIATLDQQAAVLFQQGQKELQRAGGGFADQISGLVSSADFSENLNRINDFEIGFLQIVRQAGLDEAEAGKEINRLRTAALEGDGETLKSVFTNLAGFGVAINESGVGFFKNTLPVNDAAALLATNAANMGKIVDETGKNIAEAGRAQVEGQRLQLEAIEKAMESAGVMGDLAIEINKFLSAFGGELGNVVGLLGVLGLAGVLGTLVAVAGPILLFSSALAGLALFLQKQFPEETKSIIDDVFGTAREDDRKTVQEAADRGNKESIELAVKAIKRIKENDKLSEEEKRSRIRRIKNTVALERNEDASKRTLGGFLGREGTSKISLERARLLKLEKTLLDAGLKEGENLRTARLAREAAEGPKTLDSSGFPAQVTPVARPRVEKFIPARPATVTSAAPSTANPRELSIPQTTPGQTIEPSVPVNISQNEPDSAAKNQELQIRLADKGNLLLEELIRNTRGAGANSFGNKIQKARQLG